MRSYRRRSIVGKLWPTIGVSGSAAERTASMANVGMALAAKASKPASSVGGWCGRRVQTTGEANQSVRFVHSPGPRRLPEQTTIAIWGWPFLA